MNQHPLYRYSVTIKTDDLAVLHCLRALSAHAQTTGNTRIPWGGTKKENWKHDNHRATFHFSRSEYREYFIDEVARLLPEDLWLIIEKSDNNPAKPQ